MIIRMTPNGLNWLFALATSIGVAFLGLLVPNLYKQTQKPRPHNRQKFYNEFLARHQLAYTTFFTAVFLTADFRPGFGWIKKLFLLCLIFTLASYIIGVYLTVNQDDLFIGHGCGEHGHCVKPITRIELLKYFKFNLVTAIALAIIGLGLITAVR
jgi:hypothetical protein